MEKDFDPNTDIKKTIYEAVKQINNQWILWQIYRTIKNITK